ncbi:MULTISPECIES: restriction endonuclease subunit S [unclassified Streptococcus]|uniref:restriction endonuclease subunit S n=1 Tax=unclassified Streptococcus TaxID=2608887 RepID=UPI00263C6625|nr:MULTISPECIES: restriction endonuclease subunit S [unclassified Streptococcus]MDN5022501.1 restriction endonuclease subunit S [Streptococcus sp. SP1]MDN5028063.1 restriction endonuclease subunit S [Streptococcus sp. SP4]
MNILEEIQNCPVEWKELGDKNVAKLSRGKVMSKQFLEENKGEFPVYSSQTVNNGEIGRISSFEYDGEYITWTTDGANAGTVFYRKGKFSITNVCGLVEINSNQLLTKFVYYYLTISTKKYVSSGMGNPKLMSNVMGKIKIPILPLEIQEKIVQILDKMTEYVTELTSELTSRKKQYSYYRDKLLSFEDEVYQVEWKTLEEVAKFNYGYTDKAKDTGDIRFIRITDIDENGYLKSNDKKYISLTEESRNYLVRHGDLLMARTGATYGKTLFIDTDEASAYASFLIKITPSEKLNSRYYWHFSKSTLYWKQANNLVSKAGQPQFNANSLKNIRIPVPSLEIQSRIVQVLDNFDMVCNDLNIGLPKEIELRQKQYEYFREKLLTFVAEGEYTDSTVQYRQDIIRLLNWVFGPIRVELGALGDIIRGNGLQKKDFQDVGVPCIHYGQIYTYYGIETERTKSFINSELARKLQKAKTSDLIVATTSENVEDVGKSLVWLGKEEVCIGGHSCIIRTEQNTKFLAYLFRTRFFQIQKEKRVLGTKVIELYPKNLAKIKIILPPLFEQERIVSILDHFNTLTNSLSEGLPKEIELRKKQYEYWIDELLHFHV